MAAYFGILLTTARKIVFDAMKQQDLINMIDIMVISRPSGGVQNVKVDEELREAISSIRARNSAVTLRTINSQLRKLPQTFFSDNAPRYRAVTTISPRQNIQFLPV